MKRLQLLFHNLGLGDVITFSPLVLLALDQGYAVDFVFAVNRSGGIGPLLFPGPVEEGRLRFAGGAASAGERYDVTIVFDRKVMGRVLLRGGSRDVLTIPVLAHRRMRIAIYNGVIATALRLRGLAPRAMRANPGRGIGQMVFEDFAGYLGVAADYHSCVPRVRALCLPPAAGPPGSFLVHLFRDHPLRRLEDAALERIAEALTGTAGAPGGEFLLLFDPQSPFEAQAARKFAGMLSSSGRAGRLLAAPPLAEVALHLAAAPLYVGIDHGISQLAGLLSTRSLLLYGGFRNHSGVHRTWQPVMEAEPVEETPHVSVMRSRGRAVAMIHPAPAEYLAHRREDSALINRAATPQHLRLALHLLGFAEE